MDYFNLFNYNPIPNLVCELKTLQILEVNDCAVHEYGYSKKEFLTLTLFDLLSENDVLKFTAVTHSIYDNVGKIDVGIFTHLKKNGESILIEIIGQIIDFRGEKCILIICQESFGPLKQIELQQEALKILNASIDVICSIDEAGKFIHVSSASKNHWGYTPEELKGKAYIDFVHEEDIEKTNQAAAEIISGIRKTTFQNRYIKKDGQIAYNIWSAVWDPTAKIMYTVARDAEEKLKKEELLRESESRLRTLVQDGSDLIAILDEIGNYKYVSPTSNSILGIPPEEFIGKNAFQFIHPDDTEKVMECLNKITTQHRVIVNPFRFQNNEGEWRWIETILTNMLDNPSIQGVVANSRDITFIKEHEQELELLNANLKKYNKELQQANKELEQFAFIASHDLQEPLRMVTSFMELLKRKYGDKLDEKGNQYIFFAVDGAKRMKKIIFDLLEYSRAGVNNGEKELVDINKLVEDYKSLRRKIISEKSVEIIFNNLPNVKSHLSPITQTLHSILDNAIKYSQKDAKPIVELKVIDEEKQWTFSIKDNGIGIDSSFHDKIFTIFQRLHEKDQFEGTGIGLAIVKKNVESWGGKVWVESEEDKGSTFWFTVIK